MIEINEDDRAHAARTYQRELAGAEPETHQRDGAVLLAPAERHAMTVQPADKEPQGSASMVIVKLSQDLERSEKVRDGQAQIITGLRAEVKALQETVKLLEKAPPTSDLRVEALEIERNIERVRAEELAKRLSKARHAEYLATDLDDTTAVFKEAALAWLRVARGRLAAGPLADALQRFIDAEDEVPF